MHLVFSVSPALYYVFKGYTQRGACYSHFKINLKFLQHFQHVCSYLKNEYLKRIQQKP